MRSVRNKIYYDCATSMLPSTILYSLEALSSNLLQIFTAGVLGSFAEAVFNFDLGFCLENLAALIFCVVGGLVLVPLISLTAEIVMFKNCLVHDRSILRHYFEKSCKAAMKISEGEALSRLEDDPIDLRCYWQDIVTGAIAVPVSTAYLLYCTLKISPLYTLFAFLLSLVKLLLPTAVKKLKAYYDREERAYGDKVKAVEVEITTKFKDIKLYSLPEYFINKANVNYRRFFEEVYKKSAALKAFSDEALSFLGTFCTLSILFVGAFLAARGDIAPGAVAAMIGYFAVFGTVVDRVGFIIGRVPMLKNVVDRMTVIYEGSESASDISDISFSDISAVNMRFSREGRIIFKDLSFEIKRGEKVAVTGPNGSGKSTLLKLISGIEEGYEGSCTIGDLEVYDISKPHLRKMISYIPQEGYMFPITVKENVHIGDLSKSSQKVMEVIGKVGLTHLSERLLSIEQSDISGGERRKVTIARGMMRDKPLIFIDEPDNDLDQKSLALISDFIKNSKSTVVYVSHREELIALSDKRIVLS